MWIMEIKVQANPVFKEVNQSQKRYIVMKGSAGSGKSVDTAQNYILRLLKDRGRNLVCIRKSDITNRDSTYAELSSAIYRMFGDKADKYFKVNQSPLKIECRANGNEIIFRGMNDERQREKLKSITFKKGKLTDVWIEEATELTQADFEIIDDRLRGQLPDGQFYQIRLTFNPVSRTHWIKKQFFDFKDKNVLTHHSTYLDNRFIDEAYRERMLRRKEVDPEGYQIYGLGNWGEVGGLILTNWEVADCSQEVSDWEYTSVGQDFGFNHANAILLLAYKDGDIYVLKEHYRYEKTSDEIIEEIEGVFPKNVMMYCDSAESDRVRMFRRAGYRAKKVKKEKAPGQIYIRNQINWLKQRRIFIHPSCVNLIKELGQWKWKYDERLSVYLDEPVEFFDDAIAALRYGVEPWRKNKSGQIIIPKM